MKHILLTLLLLCAAIPAFAKDSDPNITTIQSKTMQKLSKGSHVNKPQSSNVPPNIAPIIKTQDKNEIARIENYLNSFKTMKADFMQTMSDGSTLNGKVAVQRPGKIRLEYDPPNQNLLVADGDFVHVWDGQSKTGSSVPLGTSLADIILRDDIKFNSDIAVTEIKQYPAAISVTLVQKDSPDAGSLTLEFEDRPLQLKNWRVIDAQGIETRVAIYNEKTDVNIPASTFVYRDPTFGAHKN
jgi:outer membrane lipoprotein-sorting protein